MRSDGVIVGANIDTWLINVKGKLPDGLGEELDFLKEASQEADEDIPTRWTFAGETPRIQPQPRYGGGIYWGAHNIYVVNVHKSVSESLKTVHHHYFSEARHRTQWFPKYRRDFVNGKVDRQAQPTEPEESE